jgi:hypothetical protein
VAAGATKAMSMTHSDVTPDAHQTAEQPITAPVQPAAQTEESAAEFDVGAEASPNAEQDAPRREAESQLSEKKEKTTGGNRRTRRKTSDKAGGKPGRQYNRAVIIWAYPDGVLTAVNAALATRAALRVERIQVFLDPPVLLVRSHNGTEADFDAVLQVAASTGEAHARDQGWASIVDFTIVGRGNGPQRLQDIRHFLEGEAVALCIVRVNGEDILDDQLLVWAASPSAMSPLKRRLFDLPEG